MGLRDHIFDYPVVYKSIPVMQDFLEYDKAYRSLVQQHSVVGGSDKFAKLDEDLIPMFRRKLYKLNQVHRSAIVRREEQIESVLN